jgi:hypothetical protein
MPDRLSLSVARCPAVAIDPDFEIVTQIEAPVRLYKKTSDQFFANHDLIELRGELLDLAFIDGMHDAEKPSLCPRWRLSIPFHLTPSLSRQRAEFRRPGLHE